MTEHDRLDPLDPETTNPFPGLRPFEPEEDHLFFGRERETDELLRRLRTNRFVTVLGTSGSGKSSLVRCGLIPSLYSGFMVKAGSSWRVAVFRPGEDPIGNLAEALNRPAVLGSEETDPDLVQTGRMFLETTLRRSALGLADCARQARLQPHENLLVVVDQFEELFRFKESRKEHGSRDEAIAFAKLLLGAAGQDEVPVFVVITMRSDFIGDCMEYPGLPEAINEGQYLIPRMTREELRQAIEGPVAVGGGTIAPRLVARLLNEVGDDPDQLPVLQHALMRSWGAWEADRAEDRPLDVAHYEAVGTMTGALSQHAEEAYAELADDRYREIAERMFKALTDKRGDERGVRRPTPVQDVAAIAGATDTDVITVVDAFRRPGRSFLMPPSGVALQGESILDISHESLMRHWIRLVEWVDEETTSGKAYRRLCRAARRHARREGSLWVDPELALGLQWRELNKPTPMWAERYDEGFDEAMAFLDESHRTLEAARHAQEEERRAKLRRARITSAVLGTAAVITLIFGLFAVRAGRLARQAEQVAQKEARTATAVTDFMVGLFDVVDPEAGQGSSVTAREILDEGAKSIDSELADQPEVQARMKRAVGKVYGSLGLYEEALPLLTQALEIAQKTWGPDHPETHAARSRLAEVQWNRGWYREAEELYTTALDGRRRMLGDEDPATLETMVGMARVLESQGRFEEAEIMARDALAAQSAGLGPDQREALETEHLVGSILYEVGRLAESEEILTSVLARQRSTLGNEHPDVSATMGTLGELYGDLGRYDEAEKLYQDDLEALRHLYGDEHPKTLAAEYRLASLNFDRGQWDQAEQEVARVLEARGRVLGEEHPNTLQTMAYLAWIYRAQDRADEAVALSSQAFAGLTRVLGEEHLKTRSAANNLAASYSNQGRHARAEELYAANLEIYTRLYGPTFPSALSARNNLAVCYDNWGKNDVADSLYAENLRLSRAAFGDLHPQTLFYMNNMIASHRSQGRLQEALALAEESLESHKRILGPENPQTLTAMQQMAYTLAALKRFEEAEEVGAEWIDAHRKLFGDRHPETLDALAVLAGYYQGQGRMEDALKIRQEVLEGRRDAFGEVHWSTVWAYNSLAWVHEQMGNQDEALQLRTRSKENQRKLAMRENAGPHDKDRYASFLIGTQRELLDPEQAVTFAEQACEETQYRNRNYVDTLAEAYFKSGRIDDAIRMQELAISLVPPDDPRPLNWLSRRLAEFHEANGNLEPKRKIMAEEIERKRERAQAPGAGPNAKDSYAWTLLTALPEDLRNPQEALRVAVKVNEETGYEQPDRLTTLALAYHQTGKPEKAVEIQEKALEIIGKDEVWSRPNNENRLRVYRGEGTKNVDLAPKLTGTWVGAVGPIKLRVDYRREGEFINAYTQDKYFDAPPGEIVHRFNVRTGEFEERESDSGWTNLRWEHGDYRIIGDEILFWHARRWFVVRMEREDAP